MNHPTNHPQADMNTTHIPTTLALATAAFIGLNIADAATAGATNQTCDTMHAIQNSTPSITGRTATWTLTSTPQCAGATATIAIHQTAHTTFDPTETQPLAASSSAVIGTQPVTITVQLPDLDPELGGCNWQIDWVVGPPLEHVDPAHRYNEFAIGGTRNRLAHAAYKTGICAPATTTSTTPTNSTSPDTTAVPPTVTWGEPTLIPSTTAPDLVTATVPDPVTTAPEPSGGSAPGPQLPVTGTNTFGIAALGFVLTLAGMLALAAAKLDRKTKENQ